MRLPRTLSFLPEIEAEDRNLLEIFSSGLAVVYADAPTQMVSGKFLKCWSPVTTFDSRILLVPNTMASKRLGLFSLDFLARLIISRWHLAASKAISTLASMMFEAEAIT